jgi:hypothetical protein
MAARMDMNVLMTGKTVVRHQIVVVMKLLGSGCVPMIAMGAPVLK